VAYRAHLLDEFDALQSVESRILPGDIVRSGNNNYPQYRVIAVSGAAAWVRDVQYGTDHVVKLKDFRKI
jgi:hypothetical protein